MDHEQRLRDRWLVVEDGSVLVGRAATCQICLTNPSVSRQHVLLTPVHDTWIVEDLSGGQQTRLERHGQNVPLRQRQALVNGDRLHVGAVVLSFADERQRSQTDTLPGGLLNRVSLRERERDVLNALCRPVIENTGPPASNREIAEALVLSVEGVRSHLKTLYQKFEIVSGTPDQRRALLVQRAINEVYVSF